MTLPDGIHYGIDFETYRAIDAVNVSLLKELVRSPGHLQWLRLNPIVATLAMIFGSAVDCLVCSGDDEFNQRFCIKPDGLDLRTKEGKAWKEYCGERTGVPMAVVSCADAIIAHPEANEIINASKRQVTLVWTDEQTGVRCKGRPDLVSAAAVDDIKTTGGGVSVDEIWGLTHRFKYHWQICHYLNGLRTLGQDKSRGRLIFAEQKPPHGVEIFELEDDWFTNGFFELAQALESYAYHQTENRWPTSTGRIQRLPYQKPGRI